MTDEDKISKYRERVAELKELGLVRSGPRKVTLRLSSDGPAELNINEDQLRSFLLSLRQFTLQKEAVRFDHICELVRKKASGTRPELLPWVNHYAQEWDSTWSSLPPGVVISGYATLEQISKVVLYGSGMFHTNEQNRRWHEKWDSMSPQLRMTVKFALVASIRPLAFLLAMLDHIITSLEDPRIEVPQFQQHSS